MMCCLHVYRTLTLSRFMLSAMTCIQLLCHFCSDSVTSVFVGDPSLVSGCLNTAAFTTLLDLASPSEYNLMLMLFLNENSNGVLEGGPEGGRMYRSSTGSGWSLAV